MPEVAVDLRHIIKEFPGQRRDVTFRAVDDVSLEILEGEFFALLGPSGCGKTTMLRMIAGFELPTSGEILLRGKAMQDVPPFHRPVNTVFQDYALFPHMTVLQNVMFGLEMEGVKKAEASRRADEALDMVRLPQMADRKPRQLSGGQQQRVALARALVKRPQVLLLDEPLGALDLKLRKEMQIELAEMQDELGITFIFVTHDQEEALTMADRIAVMNGGKVLQVGTPEEIYDTPNSRFVADFIGETVFLPGLMAGKDGEFGWVQLDGVETKIKASLAATDIAENQSVTVAVRPEKINLFPIKGKVRYPDGSSDEASEYKTALLRDPDINLVEGIIKSANYIGTDTRYTVSVGGHDIVVRIQNYGLRSDTHFEPGQHVNVFWDAETVRILVQ
ncbi:MAG: ABC transporter ATP-binding protein [Anaerolineae bacterium]|nr:ABC transporter ATP-binding protein [Anaerolineae bacterium]